MILFAYNVAKVDPIWDARKKNEKKLSAKNLNI